MTQDNNQCEYKCDNGKHCYTLHKISMCIESIPQKCVIYKLMKKLQETEQKLKISLEDNNALCKHIEYIEKNIKKILEYGE